MKKPIEQTPKTGLRVAFITTFVPGSEPLELLDNILPAMRNAEYPHETWLLDEGDDPEARKICRKYSVNYFSRKNMGYYNREPGHRFAAKTKGGNHNAWYDAVGHEYDIVAQIDTDFIPRDDYLIKTLGYFNDPDVAFVGTPQIYGNDMFSGVARGAGEQNFTFYGPILRGLGGREGCVMLGANHVVRVSALKQIGYYHAHLTEDLITSMTLHSRKFKSIYVAEPLAIGEGPSTWKDFFNQQMRWAHGSFDILFHHTARLTKLMSKRQGLYYTLMQQHYTSGITLGAGIVLLSLYFLFGIQVSSIATSIFLITYIPLMLTNFAIATWLQRFNIRPKKEKGLLLYGKTVSVAAQPVYMMAFFNALRGKHLTFKVTPKRGVSSAKLTPLRLFVPHYILGSITLFDLLIGFDLKHLSLVLVFWAGVNTILMYGVALHATLPTIVNSLLKVLRRTQQGLEYQD